MPLDTTEFDKRIAESRFSETRADGTASGQGEAVMQLALEVVKANFPDLVARTHTKVRAEKPSPGARGEYSYGPFTGDGGIRLAENQQWFPAFSSFEPSPSAAAIGRKPASSVNITTEEVLRGVETVLHEMHHARSRAGFFNAGGSFSSLTPEQRARINELAQVPDSGYPQFGVPFASMRPEVLHEEEFMANADALLNMKERGLIPEKGITAGRMRTLENIMKEVPEVAAYIGARREPSIPTLSAPPSGTLGSIIATVDAFLNDYSVMKTSDNAKPGTRRKDLPENKK